MLHHQTAEGRTSGDAGDRGGRGADRGRLSPLRGSEVEQRGGAGGGGEANARTDHRAAEQQGRERVGAQQGGYAGAGQPRAQEQDRATTERVGEAGAHHEGEKYAEGRTGSHRGERSRRQAQLVLVDGQQGDRDAVRQEHHHDRGEDDTARRGWVPGPASGAAGTLLGVGGGHGLSGGQVAIGRRVPTSGPRGGASQPEGSQARCASRPSATLMAHPP